MSRIAAVAIGRNEGDRLIRCLDSLRAHCSPLVYVDSGSTDQSVPDATSRGFHVVQLDLSVAFTAARARNRGLREVLTLAADTEFVQFIDGDCELQPGWLRAASAAMAEYPDVAIVLGRRRERRPEATLYNRLCDLEWAIPAGFVKYCGGDILARTSALAQVGGYRETLIAGEEPELCLRLRHNNWRILCIQHEMTLHDAGITHFSQWWRRTLRGGHAFAEGAWLHGSLTGGHFVINVYRAVLWGLVVPLLAVVSAAAAIVWPAALLLLAALLIAVSVTALRAFLWRRRLADPLWVSVQYAVFCTLGKLPEALGVIRFHILRLRNRSSAILEYK